MNKVANPKHSLPKLERFLARLLDCGTYLACGVITLGLAAGLILSKAIGIPAVALGVGLIIALPVVRVVSMLAYFLRVGDLRFGTIAGVVLSIILAGILLGLRR